jgi:long-chain fatty acid transport protein
MSSAVSASTTEPAAVWYNPAALVFMPGYQVSISGVGYIGNVTFKPLGGGERIEADPTVQVVPGLFATGRLSERVALGLGVYVPFGLGLRWSDDWIGRVYGIESTITTLDINPVVAVKLLDNLSLAAGLDIMKSAVDMTNGLPTSAEDTVRIGGDGWGIGANVGLLYRLIPDQLHLAATYRSRVKLNYSGEAHFEIAEPVFSSQLFDQGGDAKITLPDIIVLGAMVRPHRTVRIGLDAYIILWSTYDKVPIDFEDPNTPDSGTYPNYRNILDMRLGAEWATPLDGFKIRGGIAYQQNPSPKTGLSPTLPDADGPSFSIGVGYQMKYIGFDLSYLLALYRPSDARQSDDLSTPPQSPEGSYRTVAHLIGLTATGRFGESENATQP